MTNILDIMSLPTGAKARYEQTGDTYIPVIAVTAAGGAPADPLAYAVIQTNAAGNGTPAIVVPANANRRGLIVTNVSDVPIYLSIGSGTSLTTSVYTIKLDPADSVSFDGTTTTQAIYAEAGAAAKNIAYQEAT